MADEKRDDKPGQQGPGGEHGQGRRFGRHRGFRGRGHGKAGPAEREDQRGDSPQEERGEAPRDMPACPLCGKPVYDLSTALAANKEGGEPAHFDCVLERVAAAETLDSGEKLVYLGSGSFAVVEFKDKNENAFAVRRRISWEKEGEKKEWRRNLSFRITSI
jgi:hypothetical protein